MSAQKVGQPANLPGCPHPTWLSSSRVRVSDMVVLEVRGDLFDAPPYLSLGHCVSQNLRMSAGIAVSFKLRFGGLAEMR